MADTYGLIARARASMLMRGHADLVLYLGPDIEAELKRILGTDGPYDNPAHIRPRRLLYMPVVNRTDMEGWAVMPAGE